MPSIQDTRIRKLYANLEDRRRTDPSVRLDKAAALEVLAAVGDGRRRSAKKVLAELQAPGISSADQVELARKGMRDFEKRDLLHLLDAGSVPLAAETKALFEAVVDRTPVDPNAPLQILGDQRNGFSGIARPGDTIEAINLTTAPPGRLHMDEAVEIGKADASGRFNNLRVDGMQEGDLIRLRVKRADGTRSDFVTVRASGIGPRDTRNALVALFRINAADQGRGKVAITNINASRQVSEPGAVLQFRNVRTGEKTRVTITEEGGFPEGFSIRGRAGDQLAVAVSDGTNNKDFAVELDSRLTVSGDEQGEDLIADPALHKDELGPDGTPLFGKKRFTGPLFKNGASPNDVQQGQIGDCYLPSAIAAVAVQNADALERMIVDNGDGTFTVTFKEKDWATGRWKDVPITVDGDLYVRAYGGPLYGSTAGPDQGERTMELWFPLIEKAYAAWKGSFDVIGRGGHSSDVMEAVLGRPGGT